jgi:hypothetical protein
MSEKIKILDPAFEYANEYVLENTRSPGLGDISTGWCDFWAIVVMRRATFVEVREWQRHIGSWCSTRSPMTPTLRKKGLPHSSEFSHVRTAREAQVLR